MHLSMEEKGGPFFEVRFKSVTCFSSSMFGRAEGRGCSHTTAPPLDPSLIVTVLYDCELTAQYEKRIVI